MKTQCCSPSRCACIVVALQASVNYIRASSSPGDLAARFATRVALFQHARLRHAAPRAARQPTHAQGGALPKSTVVSSHCADCAIGADCASRSEAAAVGGTFGARAAAHGWLLSVLVSCIDATAAAASVARARPQAPADEAAHARGCRRAGAAVDARDQLARRAAARAGNHLSLS
eukprot:5085641-Pleurochrysis_carterae.AAC.7